ncbi:hypothetical protein KC19_4G115200 [Ceratodon purpureus]|uniref:poly(ADP-ribose) glycohydrolase n=1 Tax=Ceratodon purpureus TaxID=3225 RepID=A0A8T0I9M5_CERPU|nr:hypothetical protein KC19_4G115200 [Ceratodon purpureus]
MDRFLPIRRDRVSTGSYKWPENVKYSLLALAKGPGASQVESGESLYDCILDMQRESGHAHEQHMARDTADGISLFFDDLLPRPDAQKFFQQGLPGIAKLALSLPLLLENQSQDLAKLFALHRSGKDVASGIELRPEMVLQLLCKQQRGMVVLSQRIVASLLACSFLCLYPSVERRRENLPHVNLDRLFSGIYERGESIMHKLICLLHYFERVCQNMPDGVVSFERKVITAQNLRDSNSFWSDSTAVLCPLKVVVDGNIEDLGQDCLQVDFANKMLGGGALGDGCVQEEIRFMINPELAAGMVFLPVMAANESIEIVGAERYSCYTGYASSFRFTGDFHDSMPRDAWGRKQTHVIAIDALSRPGDDQFRLTHIMRELSKAYCGFLDTPSSRGKPAASRTVSNSCAVKEPSDEPVIDNDSQFDGFYPEAEAPQIVDSRDKCINTDVDVVLDDPPGTSEQTQGRDGEKTHMDVTGSLGIATGNWGCGVFGGNLQLKSMLQWLAASQAGRPYVLYFSFQNPDAQRLQEVADWILREGWLVGELWSLVCEYSLAKHFCVNLFDWILPLPETDLDIMQPLQVGRSNHPTTVPYFIHSRVVSAGSILRDRT